MNLEIYQKAKEINEPKTQRINKAKRRRVGGPVIGRLLCTVLVWVWLIACYFIHLYGSLCMGLCVTWLMPVEVGERKHL